MIPPELRISVPHQSIYGDRKISDAIDFDERRWYGIAGPLSYLGVDGEKELEVLKRYIDFLAPNVYAISVDENGLLVSVSSDPKDDATIIPDYPPFSKSASLQDCALVKLSQLSELNRIGPRVDLVSYADANGLAKKAVFKYCVLWEDLAYMWKEMHLLKSLKGHSNIITFDRVVLDNVQSRIVGFTTVFVPGGTLNGYHNTDRVFRIEWVQQLTTTLDHLHLELGIGHGDIAPWNLVIDPETDKIQLLDFERGHWISHVPSIADLDITCLLYTIYAIISGEDHFHKIRHFYRVPEAVQNMTQWPVQCKLDSDISVFRKHLDDWVQRRKNLGKIQIDKLPAPLLTRDEVQKGPIRALSPSPPATSETATTAPASSLAQPHKPACKCGESIRWGKEPKRNEYWITWRRPRQHHVATPDTAPKAIKRKLSWLFDSDSVPKCIDINGR